jgi:hypothetical protein
MTRFAKCVSENGAVVQRTQRIFGGFCALISRKALLSGFARILDSADTRGAEKLARSPLFDQKSLAEKDLWIFIDIANWRRGLAMSGPQAPFFLRTPFGICYPGHS